MLEEMLNAGIDDACTSPRQDLGLARLLFRLLCEETVLPAAARNHLACVCGLATGAKSRPIDHSALLTLTAQQDNSAVASFRHCIRRCSAMPVCACHDIDGRLGVYFCRDAMDRYWDAGPHVNDSTRNHWWCHRPR